MAINFGNASTLANVGTASWRIHTAFTGNSSPLSTNWELADNTGTGESSSNLVTQSNGVFSFAKTGWYTCIWRHYLYYSVTSWAEMWLQISPNGGSNWENLATTQGFTQSGGGDRYLITSASLSFQIPNDSYKIRFSVAVQNTAATTYGTTTAQYTGFTIAKVAEV